MLKCQPYSPNDRIRPSYRDSHTIVPSRRHKPRDGAIGSKGSLDCKYMLVMTELPVAPCLTLCDVSTTHVHNASVRDAVRRARRRETYLM